MSEDRFEFRDIVVALLDNALVEAQAGRCQEIEVELGDDAVRVTDDGIGLPVHAHPQSGRALVEVIMTGPRRGPRNTLAKLTAACAWLDVEVNTDGALWFQRFEFARPATELERRGAATRQGTTITCAPINGEPPSFEDLRDYLRRLAEEGLKRPVKIRLLDRRAGRDETIQVEAQA